jgi:hypothetical protein
MSDLALFAMDKETGLVTFTFSGISRLVSGPEEALQLVAYHLLTTRGSNALAPEDGGSLQDITKGYVKSDEDLKTDAAIRVSRALSSIKASQTSGKAANATVTNLKLLGVASREDVMQMSVRIDLLSGNSFSAVFRI